MLGIPLIEWIGYIASIIIMISMLMSSIIKLRWINLVGSIIFSVYGFLIGSIPVGILNLFIALINVVHLYNAYSRKEYFKILEIHGDNEYLSEFLDFYKKEIQRIFPEYKRLTGKDTISVFILRNMAVSGVLLAREMMPDTLYIGLDFVIPEYRDFKLGNYIYFKNKHFFLDRGYHRLCTKSENKIHQNYLRRMGFKKEELEGDIHWVKHLV